MADSAGSTRTRRGPLQRLRLWLEDRFLRLVLVLLSYVLLLNMAVRHVGHGDAYPLSFSRLREKSYAMGKLFAHMLTHPLRTDERDPRAIVSQAARRNGVSPDFALGVAQAESDFYPHAVSATGAMGLMQLMPRTAHAYGVRDPFDVMDNADGATRLLRDLMNRYRGDHRRVLAAYNAGTSRVPRRGPYRVPSSTEAYITKILAGR